MFASSKKGHIPCVGVSIGVERVFSILLQKCRLEQVKANEVEVYVMAVVDGLLEDRMKICAELWNAGIKVCLFNNIVSNKYILIKNFFFVFSG